MSRRASTPVSRLFLILLIAVCTLVPLPVEATTRPELITQEAGIQQNLDTQLDISLPFTSASGRTAPLRDFMLPGRPTLIVPVYYGCPRLCGLTLKGVANVINAQEFKLGVDYKVLAVSFNPDETAADSRSKADENYAYLTSPESGPGGWEFLTGGKEEIRSLMTQLGFKYVPDGEEFSHSAGMMLATPGGRLSRYFTGIEFEKQDLRFALIEASQGKIGGIVDHVMLYCFRFDPTKGKYTLVVWNLTRLICGLGVVAVATLLVVLRMREG